MTERGITKKHVTRKEGRKKGKKKRRGKGRP
jgi:hypothetical protein